MVMVLETTIIQPFKVQRLRGEVNDIAPVPTTVALAYRSGDIYIYIGRKITP